MKTTKTLFKITWKKLKQSRNLFKKLIKDEKSVFNVTDRTTKTLLNKVRKSLYQKDKTFC